MQPKAPLKRWALVIGICFLLAVPALLFKFFSRAAVLHRAVRTGQVEQVAQLLGADPQLVDVRDDRYRATPLYWSVIKGHYDVMELLIDHGADLDAGDKYGVTPLHKAAVFNRHAMADRLLVFGADPEVRGLDYGAIRMTPLHKAAEAGAFETAEVLLARGADVNAVTEGENRVTPLHIAAARGHLRIVRLLLDNGANVNARDITAATPMFWARRMERHDVYDLLRLFGGRE